MEPAQSQPSFAEIYEQQLVPAVFERYARDLIDRAGRILPTDRVLDLGCGTGIVARLVRERVGPDIAVTGLDANPQMIAMARKLAPQIEWHEGNAMALPFADASFDLLLCQQMLQFPPDRAAVLREARRVLVPGGRLLLSTWRPRAELPLAEALGQVAERHLGQSNDKRYALGEAEVVLALLADAGFEGVRVERLSQVEQFRRFPVRQNALAANFDLSAWTEAEREARLAAMEADSAPVLERFAVSGGFAAPTSANLFSAVAPLRLRT